jgi:hypothetical protein
MHVHALLCKLLVVKKFSEFLLLIIFTFTNYILEYNQAW